MLRSGLTIISILLRVAVAYESSLISKLSLVPANASQFNLEDISLSPDNNPNEIQDVSSKNFKYFKNFLENYIITCYGQDMQFIYYQDGPSLKDHCQNLEIEKRIPRGFQAMRGKKRVQFSPGDDLYEKLLKMRSQKSENLNMSDQQALMQKRYHSNQLARKIFRNLSLRNLDKRPLIRGFQGMRGKRS